MHKIVAKTTLSLAIGTMVLTGCSESKPADPATTSTPATSAPTATTEPTPATEGIVGDWSDDKAKWTVHFKDDGTFVEDFDGISDFRAGEYTVVGDTVSLIGGDGNTDKGTIEGSTIKFNLGTLTRQGQSQS